MVCAKYKRASDPNYGGATCWRMRFPSAAAREKLISQSSSALRPA